MERKTQADVLAYWFQAVHEGDDTPLTLNEHAAFWFFRSKHVDTHIRSYYAALFDRAIAGEVSASFALWAARCVRFCLAPWVLSPPFFVSRVVGHSLAVVNPPQSPKHLPHPHPSLTGGWRATKAWWR